MMLLILNFENTAFLRPPPPKKTSKQKQKDKNIDRDRLPRNIDLNILKV